jgi:hypothetical protein
MLTKHSHIKTFCADLCIVTGYLVHNPFMQTYPKLSSNQTQFTMNNLNTHLMLKQWDYSQ